MEGGGGGGAISVTVVMESSRDTVEFSRKNTYRVYKSTDGLTAQTHTLEKEAESFLDQHYKGAQIRAKLQHQRIT